MNSQRVKTLKSILSGIILTMGVIFGFFFQTVSAVQVPFASVSLSSHTKSVSADHTYRFQTPSGIDSPSDTITIDLSEWATGLVDYSDMDLYHGPVTGVENNNGLASVAAPGVWGAGFSLGILTLTPPSDAAPGTVAADDYITLYIGENALAGVNQLTNPATVGNYPITIAGGFGDTAYMAQAIVNQGSIGIEAYVGISLRITSIDPSSVGPGASGFVMTVTGTGFVTSSVGLINDASRETLYISPTELQVSILASDVLFAGTKYITVYDPLLFITSNQFPLSITTPTPGGDPGDTTPPVITNTLAINITQTGARIVWDTDEAATSMVQYGLTDSYGDVVSGTALVTSHGIDLTGLQSDTVYHFRVSSADQYGNSATGADLTFATTPSPPLEIYNVGSISILDTSAIIIWDTNRNANSKVEYGQTAGLGSFVSQTGFISSHSVELASLAPNTQYHYRVISYDIANIGATSTIYTFNTTADSTPPTNITLNADPGDTLVQLSWVHPTEVDFAGVRLERRTDGFPSGPFSGDLIYDGLDTSTTNTGLTNGTTYYYAAYAYDTNGNFASGALAEATPFAVPVPPVPTPTSTTATTTPPTTPTTPVVTPPADPGTTTTTTTPPILPGQATGTTPGTTTTTTPTPVVSPDLPASDVTPMSMELQNSILYYGAGGTLALGSDSSGIYGVLPGESITVRVTVANLGQTAQSAIMIVNGQIYSLTPAQNGTEFTGTFLTPASGAFVSHVQVTLSSGIIAEAWDNFLVQGFGYVLEPKISTAAIPIPGAMVTLYSVVNGTPILWNGSPYGQANPILSDKDGNFVFRVPNGEYLMEAGKVGYKTQRSPAITIQNNIFGRNIELLRLPEPIFTEICQIDCSSIDYDIYIVGSDGVERHINTDFVQSKDLGNGIFLYSFEVDGKDFDYNDALLQVDYSNCQRLKIIILKTSADTKQSVRVKIIYKGDLRNDVLLTADAHEEQGNTLNLNLSSDPAICESITTQVQIGAIAKQVEYAVLSALEAIQDPKLVKITDEWAAPVLTIAAASNFGTALGFINIFTYSRFLFTQPLLLFGRIRRRRWGVVYNSLTKQPIDLVIIRLLHKETGAVVQSRVTDKRGRYYFQVNPGNYTLQVVKSEYSFPTQYLGNKNVDAVYADIYHGDTINMVENGFIAYNIPMDPAIPESTPRKIIYRNFFQKLRHIIALSGAFLAVVSLVISPSPLMVALVIFQVVMYFAFRRLTLSAKAKSWGKIYDADTKKPISGAIIRIFDKKFNKLLETQLSSGVGGYGFFVEHNSYYVVVEKPGYQKYTSKTLDLGSLKESIVDLSIPLQRVTAPKT